MIALALGPIFDHNRGMKYISFVLTVLLAQALFAQVDCAGWVGSTGESTGQKFDLIKDIDHEEQTSYIGGTEDLSVVFLYFKKDGQVQTSLTDRKTKVTVGTHAGFDDSGNLTLGFSLLGVAGQADRRATLNCKRFQPDAKTSLVKNR